MGGNGTLYLLLNTVDIAKESAWVADLQKDPYYWEKITKSQTNKGPNYKKIIIGQGTFGKIRAALNILATFN